MNESRGGGQCTFAAWSPSGEWMYFSSDSGGAFHTWRQQFPDGEPEDEDQPDQILIGVVYAEADRTAAFALRE